MRFDPRRWLVVGVLFLSSIAASAQTPREDAGLERLLERLGAGNQPTGAGVVVAQVEVGTPESYVASANHPELIGKRFEMLSGRTAPSAHATWVGLFFYGLDAGIAPGIEDVQAYEVLDWLGDGFVRGSGPIPPAEIGVAIVNNSWIGDAGGQSNAYVRKIDYAIDDQSVTILGGTPNGHGALSFPLLTHCFNGICVGRTDGRHGAGETSGRIDGPGRMKPDLVGPAPASSFATPLVAGAAALLVETARETRGRAGLPAVLEPEMVKALLMAGARHRLGWSNGAPNAGPARGATDRPLDPLFGADVVDVDRSHWILTAGESAVGSAASEAPEAQHAGWTQLELASGESRWLRFEVAGEKPQVSVLAAWNRRVHADFAGYDLPDLDLELHAVGRDGAPTSLVGLAGLTRFAGGNVSSASKVDNVEHLYIEGLRPGSYLLELRRANDGLPSWHVALAWELACPVPRVLGSGKPTSLGSSPRLSAHGVPAAFADEFALDVAGAIPGQMAVLVRGNAVGEESFGGGTLFASRPLERIASVCLDETGAARIPIPIEDEWIGGKHVYQVLFLDPAQLDGTGAGLTNGLEVTFCR